MPKPASISAQQQPAPWFEGWMGACVIIALAFAAYLPALHAGFIWDDDFYLTQNPLLSGTAGIWKIWTTTESPQYYPLVFTTFWIEKFFWGLNPVGFHAVNILLHGANAVLAWRLLRRGGIAAAWIIGAVFALHPVHVESVAWITERKNVLSGLFYFLSALCFVESEEGKGGRWYALSLLAFACALFSKTVTSTLPVALLLFQWMRGKKIDFAFLLRLVPFFLLGLGMGLVTIYYEKLKVGAQGAAWGLSFADRLVLAGRILWFYAGKLFWPTDLAFMYERWSISAAAPAQWIPGISFAALLGSAWGFRGKIGRGAFACLAYFTVTLLPALGFFSVYPMRYSYVADHFQYLASLGIIALGVGAGGFLLKKRPALARAVSVAALAALFLLTWRQGPVYKDEEALWKDTITKTPSSWMAYNNLGLIHYRRKEYDQALAFFEQGWKINPRDAETCNNMGVIHYERGDIEKARDYFEQAVAVDPAYSDAHNNLGGIYFANKDYGRALEHFELALSNARLHKEAIQRNVDVARARLATEKS